MSVRHPGHRGVRGALCLCALVLWCCAAAADAPVTIRFWHFFDLDAWRTFGALIDEFNDTHPDIRVVAEYQGAHGLLTRKLIAAIVAGVPPEVTTVGCNEIPRLADTGWLVPISLSEAARADIYESLQRAYTYRGELWAMSVEGAAYGLYWNKALFREAGLEERPPETWDELIAVGKALTRDRDGDGAPDQWGFIRGGADAVGPSTIFNIYFANEAALLDPDGSRVLFDTPEVVEVLQLWKGLADTHHITENVLPPQPIERGLIGMWIGGSWSYNDLARTLDIGVAPIPPLRRRATLAGPDAVVIARSTPEKEAAAQAFVQWLTAPEQFARVCIELGYLPIRESLLAVPEYQAYLARNPEKRALSEAMKYLYIKPLHGAWSEIQEAMHTAREKVERGLLDPAAAAREGQERAQAVLDHYIAEQAVEEDPVARRRFHLAVIWIAAGAAALLGWRLIREYRRLRADGHRVQWAGYALILPQLALFCLFDVFPIGFALYMSFFQWDMLTPPAFVALHNYLRVFSDPDFLAALKRTLIWVVATVPVNTAIALAVALLLNTRIRGIGFFRLVFYSPSVTSGVALAIIWWWILNGHSGLLNYALQCTGIQRLLTAAGIGQIDWLNDERFALFGLIVMDWWRALAAFLIFLAGLQGIPDSLYEAAQIDGAGRWVRFRSITWPLLMPATFFVVVTTVIAAFQVFEQIYVMTVGEGGPSGSTTTVNFYLYKNAFNWFRMGYASSIAYVLGLLVLVITLVQRRFLGKEVEY
ncbi:MAG: extracellular solute-binding protein [Candidatus Hydrogenedentes bacterium]|nr:extracellular solute-binding protein [Candidatus Hydrogenedentota bacterium]